MTRVQTGRTHTRLTATIGALALMASVTTGAPADDMAWSVARCQRAIRQLINQRRVLYHFQGPARAEGPRDIFQVDPRAHVVVYAHLWSRMDDRFYTVGDPMCGKQEADPEEAEQLAFQIAREHCPQVLGNPNMLAKDLGGSPYIFKWRQVALPWGVRLPREVVVSIDAITGQFCSWRLRLADIVIDLEPRRQEQEVTEIVQRAVGYGPEAQTEIYPRCIGVGDEQRLLWDAHYRLNNEPIVVCVDDETGRVEAVLPM